jgi:hypothetical protein
VFLSLYKYLTSNPQLWSAGEVLQAAGVYLSMLLVFVGISVLIVMLNTRGEYLYIKTINGTRQYFREQYSIDPKYLVLPSNLDKFTFGQNERWGRAFWEAMIVAFTTSMFLTFLFFEAASRFGVQKHWPILTGVVTFVAFSSCSCLVHRQATAGEIHRAWPDGYRP